MLPAASFHQAFELLPVSQGREPFLQAQGVFDLPHHAGMLGVVGLERLGFFRGQLVGEVSRDDVFGFDLLAIHCLQPLPKQRQSDGQEIRLTVTPAFEQLPEPAARAEDHSIELQVGERQRPAKGAPIFFL